MKQLLSASEEEKLKVIGKTHKSQRNYWKLFIERFRGKNHSLFLLWKLDFFLRKRGIYILSLLIYGLERKVRVKIFCRENDLT